MLLLDSNAAVFPCPSCSKPFWKKKAVIWTASAVFHIPQLQMLCCQQWHRREACLLADTLIGWGWMSDMFLETAESTASSLRLHL